jgi:hypothetical protein
VVETETAHREREEEKGREIDTDGLTLKGWTKWQLTRHNYNSDGNREKRDIDK